jgi:hypothetical protein
MQHHHLWDLRTFGKQPRSAFEQKVYLCEDIANDIKVGIARRYIALALLHACHVCLTPSCCSSGGRRTVGTTFYKQFLPSAARCTRSMVQSRCGVWGRQNLSRELLQCPIRASTAQLGCVLESLGRQTVSSERRWSLCYRRTWRRRRIFEEFDPPSLRTSIRNSKKALQCWLSTTW